MGAIHDFEERILPGWWHQAPRLVKVAVGIVLLGISAILSDLAYLGGLVVIIGLSILAGVALAKLRR